MKKHLMMLVSVVLMLAPAEIWSQQKISIRRNLEIIFTSAPAAPDLVEMIAGYDEPANNWSVSRHYLAGIKFYQGQALTVALSNVGSNTYNILAKAGVFRVVRDNLQLKTSLEVGAIKPQNCLSGKVNVGLSTAQTVEVWANVYLAGGNVESFAIDTSLGPCNLKPAEAAIRVGLWSRQVEDEIEVRLASMRVKNPDLSVLPIKWGDIEPYPSSSIAQHEEYIDKLNYDRMTKRYTSFSYYDLDIDLGPVKDDAVLARDVNRLIDFLRPRLIKMGLIINGEDSKSPATDNGLFYRKVAMARLARFKRLGLLDRIDRLIVQSWSARSNGKQDFPYNVPETDSLSHTNLLRRVEECLSSSDDDCRED